jgi:sporulation protein YlmC with PRC-barrel domain
MTDTTPWSARRLLALAAPVMLLSGGSALAGRSMDHVNFASYTEVDGRDIFNKAGEEIAEVSDLVVDRGSGRVAYVVIEAGGTLGIGQRAVAVPYSAFSWAASEDRLVLDTTAEALKAAPAFNADDWVSLNDALARERAYGQLSDEVDEWGFDPYRSAFTDNPRSRTVRGIISRVDRDSTESGEVVRLTIRSDDGTDTPVVVGPSWYVLGALPSTPERGMRATIEAVEFPRDEQRTLIAKSIELDGQSLRLRGDQGDPAWSTRAHPESAEERSTPYRFLLLGDVIGADCRARAENCGEIETALLECHSGMVLFLAVDPNKNFLGINDRTPLVPWSIASVGTDTVRLDASKDMILASQALPEELDTLERGDTWIDVYRAFEVDSPRLRPVQTVAWAPSARLGWTRSEPLCASIVEGKETMISGTVKSVIHAHSIPGAAPATALVVNTPSGEKTVLLGPAWYMSRQHLDLEPGDVVRVQCLEGTHDGQSVIAACSLSANGRTTTIWRDRVPMWDQR